MVAATAYAEKTTRLERLKLGFRTRARRLRANLGDLRRLWRDAVFWIDGRDWDLSFGPIEGKAGTTRTITVEPEMLFRGEKLLATDSAKPAGTGTRITQILVGARLQKPATGGGTLTAFFGANALGNGLRWDDCKPGQKINLTVSFVQSCTFDAVVFGRAVLDY